MMKVKEYLRTPRVDIRHEVAPIASFSSSLTINTTVRKGSSNQNGIRTNGSEVFLAEESPKILLDIANLETSQPRREIKERGEP